MRFRISRFGSDSTGWIGAATMIGFAVLAAWRGARSGLWYFALLTLRDLAAAWFLLIRAPSTAPQKNRTMDVVAYASSALPLIYQANSDSPRFLFAGADSLAILGFALATIALLELGTSFGVSPANRGRVRSGPYGLINHPMYVGYAIAELGFVLIDPSNAWIYVVSISLYCRFFRVSCG